VIVAAGGWAGDVDSDSVKKGEEEEYIKEAAEVAEKMMRVNYYPVVAGSLIGQRCMDANGETLLFFLVLPKHHSSLFKTKHLESFHRSICHHRCICCIVTYAWNDRLWIK
jgi:hypothetical protein